MLESHFKAYLDRLKKLPELPPEMEMRKAFSAAGWSPADIEEALAYVNPKTVAPPAPVMPAPQVPASRPIDQSPAPIPPATPIAREPIAPATPLPPRITPVQTPPPFKPIQPVAPSPAPEPVKVSWPSSTPPTPPAAQRPVPPQPPTPPQPPLARTMVAPQPASSPSSYVVTPGSQPLASKPASSHRSRNLVTFLLILAILGAGIAYAYVQKIGPFFDPPYPTDFFFSGMAKKMLEVDSYSYDLSFSLKTEPREESTSLYDYDFSTDRYISAIPPVDIKGEITSEGAIEGVLASNPDSRAKVAGSFSALDIATEFDLDVVKKGDLVYINVHKVPAVFLFSELKLQPLLNKWIEFNVNDFGSVVDPLLVQEFAEELGDAGITTDAEKKELARKLAAAFDAHKAFTLHSNPSFGSVGGVGAYRYSFKINLDGLLAAMQEIVLSLVNDVKPLSLEEQLELKAQMLKEISSPEFAEVRKFVEYINQNGTTELWIDAETGHLLQAAYSLRFAPKSLPALKDKQLHFEFKQTLSNIDKPQTIEAPTETIPHEEALILMSGKSRQAFLHEKQSSQIQALQSELHYRQSVRGSYPETLQDVLGGKTVQDVVAKVPYLYFPSATNYKLLYQIDLPPKEAQPDYYSVVEQAYPGNILALKYVNGTNTATADVLSLEAAALAKKDTDKDGVSDALEEYVGTSKTLADTDKDGIKDGSEIRNILGGVYESSISW